MVFQVVQTFTDTCITQSSFTTSFQKEKKLQYGNFIQNSPKPLCHHCTF